jgi:eukaryotic-like serine/threonine-protein kinase
LLASATVKEPPPKTLVDLLANLGLATAGEVQSVGGRVRRLSGGQTQFESPWVDALSQARVLTPWQAAEINAGRGSALKMGPFVAYERLVSLGYATVFRAREIESRRFVRLSVAGKSVDRDDAERRLSLLSRRSNDLNGRPLAPVVRHGRDGDLLWAACDSFAGRTARQWMIEHGRLPPAAVLEIARQMLVGLVACERAAIPHADLGADQLWFDHLGQVRLPEPGLRGALRPIEGYSQTDLSPEAYDYFAPERAADGRLADSSSDVYACGALWWHLLTGRPPLAGATALAKLRAAQMAKLPNIRHLAPDTAPPLAEAIMSCLAQEPADRPASLAALAGVLGEPTLKGQKQLARLLRPESRSRARLRVTLRGWRRSSHVSTWLAAAAGVMLAMTIISWPAVWGRVAKKETGGTSHLERQVVTVTTWPTEGVGKRNEFRSTGAGTERNKFRSTDRLTPPSVAPALQPDVRQAGKPDPSMVSSLAAPAAERNGFRSTNAEEPIVQAAFQVADNVVRLAPDEMRADFTRLTAGQTVRGDDERRSRVTVPPEGLEVTANDVTFENIDFVAEGPSAAGGAMLVLRGLKATFHRCSFTATQATDDLPVAIFCDRGADSAEANAELSTGELEIRDSTFERVTAAVSCRMTGGMVVRLENVLRLGPGLCIQVDRFPRADEMLAVAASRVTLRGASSLVEVGCDELPQSPGHLEIEAVDCAFALPPAAALVVYHGAARPGPLLKKLRWTGQGSVLSPRSRLSIWRMPEGRMLAAADEAVPIEGVVRGEVGFAGELDEGRAASRIIRWQAPLNSPHPPGIDDSRLPPP